MNLLSKLWRPPAIKKEIDEELRFHIEQRTAENIAAGMTAEEAAREARKRFGNLQSVREECRERRGASFGESFFRDIRFGLRILRKSPGFTAVAVVSIALGIGAGAAVFSLVNAILLRSLPTPNPQELRIIEWSGTDVHNTRTMGNTIEEGPRRRRQDAFSYPAFQALREQCATEADIFGYAPLYDGLTARALGGAVTAEGMMVSDNFFPALGVRPLIGRLLGAEDEPAGSAPAVVISYRWWERQFDLDPSAIGHTVVINGSSFTVVGVLPRGFAGVRPGAETEIYAPMSAQPQLLPDWPRNANDAWWVPVMARLKPGVSDAQFRAALNVAFAPSAQGIMDEPKIWLTDGRAGPEGERGRYRDTLMLLLGVVGVVLLVACANLAGLLLARGNARQHEFAVRAALGAGRGRLVLQLMTESLLVAALGGGLGVVIAIWGKTVVSRLLAGSPEGLHYDTTLDFRVVGFALTAVVVTAVLSGLIPALRAGSADARAGLKERTTFGAPRGRAGRALVAGQIAFSLVLLAGAGLYVRTLINLVHVNPGFPTKNLLLFQLKPGNAGYKEPQLTAFYERVQQSLSAIPGVRSAALTQYALLGGVVASGSFKIPGHPADAEIQGEINRNGPIEHGHARQHPFASGPRQQTYQLTVSETFFTTMDISLLQGRALSESDGDGTPKVAVINESFAQKFFPGESPVGQELNLHGSNWQIVGVCRDSKYADIEQENSPTLYFSFRQASIADGFFALRTTLPPLAVASAARKAVAAIDPNIPLIAIQTQEEVRDATISQERMFAVLCGSLAVFAVLLSCIGLYGLMAYQVARRTGEIGIRMALGATRRQIAAPVLREALLLGAAGAAVGLPLTMALTRLIRSNLFGVEPCDPFTLGGAMLLLLAVALAAAWIPARRAAKVDPIVALRHE
jgi:predicted permease